MLLLHNCEVEFQVNEGAHWLQDVSLSQEIQFVEQLRQASDDSIGFL